MFDVGQLVARLKLEGTEVFGRDLRAMGKEWDGLSDKGKAAARDVGGAMTGIGASVVALGALSIKAAIDWETAWTGVTKTVDGTSEELQKLEGDLRGLTKVLPATHTEIAGVAEAAGQLGIETQNVAAFTRTMIDMGETTNLSSEEAATALARFMNVMGTAQDKTSNLGSAVVELGNNYATTEAEIVAMGSRLSGAARQVGLTEGQTMGLAAALSAVGIEAEAGGSAVSKVMIDIAASVDEGGERVAKFAAVAGMSADTFSKKWKTDPGAALAAFVKGLANAEAQGTSTLGVLADLGITEVRMRDALLKSAAASDQFAEAMTRGNDAFEENTALAAEAEKRYATVESQIAMMGNSIKDAAIDFGAVFLPAVSQVVAGVSEFATVLGSLPEGLQGILAFGTMGAGSVALFGGMLLLTIPKIVEFRAALRTLGKEMPQTRAELQTIAAFLKSPWGIAIAAGVAGVAILSTVLEGLQSTSAEVANSLLTASDAAEVFLVLGKGKEWAWTRDVTADLNDLPKVLEASAMQSENFWQRFNPIGDQGSAMFGAFNALKDTGKELAKVAATDLPAAQRAFQLLSDKTDGTAQSQWRLLNALGPEYMAAVQAQATAQGIQTTTADEATNQTRLLAVAFGDAGSAAAEGAAGTLTGADAYAAAADEAGLLRDQLTQLIDKIMEANGTGQDVVSTNARYQESLAGIGEEVQRQKDAYEKAHDTLDGFSVSLDQGTAAGSANAAMLADVARNAQDAALAQFELDQKTMTGTDATRRLTETLAGQRQAMIDAAIAAGMNAEEVAALTEQIFGVPDAHETLLIIEKAAATSAIDQFVRDLNNIPGQRDVVINQVVRTTGAARGEVGAAYNANGNIWEAYANGGTRENHVAQIARAGANRIWAEDETGGEAYIPLAPAKRDRSESILRDVADRFGFDLARRGDGDAAATEGSAGASSTRRVGDFSFTVINPISRNPVRDAQDAAQILYGALDVPN